MDGFIYPNSSQVVWNLLIVIYPYITGLVAGAFIISSLYHVFGLKALKPVARLSLLTAFAFLLVAAMPLLVHSGRPERALEMFRTPNLNSAMSMFGYIMIFYLLLLTAEIWLAFRYDIVTYHDRAKPGVKKVVYAVMALGVYDISEKAVATDEKVVKVLAAVGVPSAVLLHGYVGFIFGGVTANPWWSTPLMPLIFLLSAIVSGIALATLLYAGLCRVRRVAVDRKCLGSMLTLLMTFLIVDVLLEGLEIISMMYEAEESWVIISQLITQKIQVSFFVVQLGLGALVPLMTLGLLSLLKVEGRLKMVLGLGSAALVLVGVFAMRWNVVIGGQLFSKSLRGFTTYTPTLLGKEGLLVGIALVLLPFLILGAISYFIPPWQDKAELVEFNEGRARERRVIYG